MLSLAAPRRRKIGRARKCRLGAGLCGCRTGWTPASPRASSCWGCAWSARCPVCCRRTAIVARRWGAGTTILAWQSSRWMDHPGWESSKGWWRCALTSGPRMCRNLHQCRGRPEYFHSWVPTPDKVSQAHKISTQYYSLRPIPGKMQKANGLWMLHVLGCRRTRPWRSMHLYMYVCVCAYVCEHSNASKLRLSQDHLKRHLTGDSRSGVFLKVMSL